MDDAIRNRGGWQRPNWAATSPRAEIAQMIGVAIFNKCGSAHRKLLQRSTPGATSNAFFWQTLVEGQGLCGWRWLRLAFWELSCVTSS